jgi:hypothetical protein
MSAHPQPHNEGVPTPVVSIHHSVERMEARIFPLLPLKKTPATEHGVHDAQPAAAIQKTPTCNYGIQLHGMVCVDWDSTKFENDPDVAAFYRQCEATATWAQRTGGKNRGVQFLFKTDVPLPTRTPIRGTAKSSYGEVLSGDGCYIVGPNSLVLADSGEHKGKVGEYQIIADADPIEAPAWLIDRTRAWSTKPTTFADLGKIQERDAIPAGGGSHREAMLRYLLDLRSHQGLKVDACVKAARAFIDIGMLEGYDPSHPFTDSDLRAMAEGVQPGLAGTAEPSPLVTNPGAVVPTDLALAFKKCITHINFSTTVEREVFINGLLWRAELHVFYGQGGVGKTGLGAFCLAQVSKCSYEVAVIINEDSEADFFKRYIASGGAPDRLSFYDEEKFRRLMLPDDGAKLRDYLATAGLGAVYFDSIMDNRAPSKHMNAAEEARQWAGVLSTIAQTTNTAIICTAHENSQGHLEGAQQIKNKARCVARVTAAPGSTLSVKVEKANRGRVGTQVAFECGEVVSQNPLTGEIEYERMDDGTMAPRQLYVLTGIKERPFSLSEIPDSKAKRPRLSPSEQLAEFFLANPGEYTRQELEDRKAIKSVNNRLTPTLRDNSALFPSRVVDGRILYRYEPRAA